MRYRLRFQVDHDYGSLLPLNYQLEVAKFIKYMLTEDAKMYRKWLSINDIPDSKKLQLFNFSNLIVLDRKIYGDRMLILADTIELTVSFYHDNMTDDLVLQAFERLTFTIGDQKSSIRLKVVEIDKLQSPAISNQMMFVARSPIVVQSTANNRYLKFMQPSDIDYEEYLIKNLINKYEELNGISYPDPNFFPSLEVLTEPKSKLLGINTQKKEFIKGYLYRFLIKAPKDLLRIGYQIGFGDRNHYGFGFCDVLYKEPNKIIEPTLTPDESSLEVTSDEVNNFKIVND